MEAAMVAGRHWRELSDSERAKLTSLLRKSRGLPSSLSQRERDELRRLVGKLDLVGAGRELLPFARRSRR